MHGHQYAVIFVDEFSGYVEPHFMKTLDETEDKYRLHRQLVKTHFNKNIKHFVCDGHGSYVSKSMISLMKSDGTILRVRAPYDPNGNAIAERTIRTIFEMARTILLASGLPQNR